MKLVTTMSMTFRRWNKLPPGFLEMKFDGFKKYKPEAQSLIVELARLQGFKCALCDEKRNLIVEHDHTEDGHNKTIYNIRGLACRSCNRQLRLFEKERDAEIWLFENAICRLTDSQYDNYTYEFECRVAPLIEEREIERMGAANYFRRKFFLWKFDDWNEIRTRYPWKWGFEEIKARRHGAIRTPKQFFRTLLACASFVKEQMEHDPNYIVPDTFIKIMIKAKPLVDKLLATEASSTAPSPQADKL